VEKRLIVRVGSGQLEHLTEGQKVFLQILNKVIQDSWLDLLASEESMGGIDERLKRAASFQPAGRTPGYRRCRKERYPSE
jgi:hypothetical protein